MLFPGLQIPYFVLFFLVYGFYRAWRRSLDCYWWMRQQYGCSQDAIQMVSELALIFKESQNAFSTFTKLGLK